MQGRPLTEPGVRREGVMGELGCSTSVSLPGSPLKPYLSMGLGWTLGCASLLCESFQREWATQMGTAKREMRNI